PWVVAVALQGLGIQAEMVAPLAGLAILGSAFMLAWSCEIAERDIPQSLALLVLALVGVLPEYAIDLHFAWQAGSDPSYAHYATANMTGANRMLIGLGWVSVILVACWRSGSDRLAIHPRQNLELRYLIWATIYSFFIPLGGEIGLIDAGVLLALFAAYVKSAMGGETPGDLRLGGTLRRESGHDGAALRRGSIPARAVGRAAGLRVSGVRRGRVVRLAFARLDRDRGVGFVQSQPVDAVGRSAAHRVCDFCG
ncbi:MAG: hypothetical protein JRG94_23475, partial [Deltaproteobacteria bacterium]|nr:hypothetical protein [Deltaproteobacteria bacterium]